MLSGFIKWFGYHECTSRKEKVYDDELLPNPPTTARQTYPSGKK